MPSDPDRLRTSEVVTRRLIDANGSRAGVEATLDRRAALQGADDVVTSFQVRGLRPSTAGRRGRRSRRRPQPRGVLPAIRARRRGALPRPPPTARREPDPGRQPRPLRGPAALLDEHLRAAMLDPHTAAELSLDEISQLVGELLEAHGDMIPRLR